MAVFNNEVKRIPKEQNVVHNASLKHISQKNREKRKEESSADEPQIPYSWDASEYVFREKTPDWYWSIAIIALGIIGVSAIFKNFLLGVLAVLAGFTLALIGSRRPNLITITITGHGVQIGDRLFPYDTLKSFWIFYEPGGRKELVLVTDGMINPSMRVQLGTSHPADVRALLSRYVREKQEEESFVDIVSQLIGL